MQDTARNIVIKDLPGSAERRPLFIVGDVHGCARELRELVNKARQRVSDFQLVLVGDLFTKGPDPVGVFDLIHEFDAICIKGNHDWALWAALVQAQRRGMQSLPEHTQQTLHLVRHHRRALFDFVNALPHAIKTSVKPARKRKGWEAEYPMLIVHAGIDPVAGVAATPERMLLTARYVRWDNPSTRGKLLLVPSGYRAEMLAEAEQKQALGRPTPKGSAPELPAPHVATRARPDVSDKFRWHELHTGPELIVFGHDAKQGLFRKTLPSGRPICVGLDTGCTYGRQLTGYFPELDDAVQVDAKRSYFDLNKNVIVLRGPSPRIAV
ncbi:MAG: serine/threonine protein phosphatase [Betaproteobacteria bacterium]|nr:serine/threonine protein phosphatase [Betaproteobacteria bacterium]